MGLIQSALNDVLARSTGGSRPIPPYPADTSTPEGMAQAIEHKEAHIEGGYAFEGNIDYCVVENGLPGHVVLGRATRWCLACKYANLNNPRVLEGGEIDEARADPTNIQGCWTSTKRILEAFDESQIRRIMNANQPAASEVLKEAVVEASRS